MPTSKEIQQLQDQLNKDATLRAAFLKDPVKVLQSNGVALTPAAAKDLKAQFSSFGIQRIPTNIPQLKFPKIGISIRITISF